MKHSFNFIKSISNPVYKDLLKLKLIKSKNLRVISNNTRNKRIKVIQDTKEKIIFLQKYLTTKNYYRQSKNNIIINKNTIVVINKKKIKLSGLDDNVRRYKQFKKLLNNKYVLDYGCGSGNFLKKIKNTKHIYGVEISKNHIKHLAKSKQFKNHNQISINIYWSSINTQIRMKAIIRRLSKDFNMAYFKTRDLKKNALAISSKQSQVIRSFSDVKKDYDETFANKELTICPEYWGGFAFQPFTFEFWEGHDFRLNKREVFEKNQNAWSHYLLQP